MSGWIKFEKDLLTDPRTIRIAQRLSAAWEVSPTVNGSALAAPHNAQPLPGVTVVLGGLVTLWSLADTHIGDDDILPLGVDEIDELIRLKGFCELLPADWLQVIDAHSVKLPGYHEHNGTIAKERAQGAKRQARFRQGVTIGRDGTRNKSNGRALPDQDQTKTKTRPRQEIKPSVADATSVSDSITKVFVHWQTEYLKPRATLDAKRKRVIREGLAKYSEADLCQAISGYKNSPHHMGHNERNTVYDDIELFLRDAKHIDAGLNFYANPPRADLSEKSRKIASQTENWVPPEMRSAAN